MARRTIAPTGRATTRRSAAVAAAATEAPRDPLLRAALAISIDGYIARRDGDVEWLHSYHSPEIDFAGFRKTIGATVYGRATYDFAMTLGRGIGSGGRAVVLTHRPIADAPRGVEAFGGDVRELAARLRRELAGTGRDIWLIGGGRSIASFRAHGLVDRWELSIVPVMLGEGIPLFPPGSGGLDAFRLTRSRTLRNGIVEVWYEPASPRDGL